MRKKRLALNTASSLLFQATSVLCGFILPRMILEYYGSEVNGLVNSIAQFIRFISFMELGVGAVVQSALYKPLAERNNEQISRVMVSAQRFFRMLAGILLVYVIVLIVGYPFLVNREFDWLFSAALVAAISISSFAQYYFGIVNMLLLNADQRGYIQYLTHMGTLLLNTIVCIILMRIGQSIHVVQLATSLIYLLRPILLKVYVNRHYQIDYRIKNTEEPIKQKWNGIAQHVASIVLDNTDMVVLTVFSTLTNVSIYHVYHLVVFGIKHMFSNITNGIQSLLGELWAKQEMDRLVRTFEWTEWVLHTAVVFTFGCTMVLICPFVQVYTKGIGDANYIVPTFAFIITLANALHGLRMPYITMIFAGDKYKETQSCFIISAILNFGISAIVVNIWGLVGVALGTLVAMAFQTIWMAIYLSKNLVCWPIRRFLRQLGVDVVTWVVAYFASFWLKLTSVSYGAWLVLAIEVALIWLAVVTAVNLLFYRGFVKAILHKVSVKLHK